MSDAEGSMLDELQTDLTFVKLTQGPDLELTIIVRQFRGSEEPAEIIGRHVRDIMSAPTVWIPAKTFEIRFPECFAFMSRDEMASAHEEGVVLDGTQFRRYKESKFLDFIEQMAYSDDVRPHPLYHYSILFFLDGVIDVVAPRAPEIRYLGLSS